MLSLDEARPRPRAHAQHSASERTGEDPTSHDGRATNREARPDRRARLESAPRPEGRKAEGGTEKPSNSLPGVSNTGYRIGLPRGQNGARGKD